MPSEIDIHGHGERLKRAVKLVRRLNPVSERSKAQILKFAEHCEALGLSRARISRYVYLLKQLAKWLEKDFDRADRQDIERLVHQIETSDYATWTKQLYKVALKRFYKWLLGGDEEYPNVVKWVKTTFKQKDKILPNCLLTEDEIKKLVEAADNPRDRAFIMTLYETGGRVGEVGSLRIRDIEFRQEYASVVLKGKTGSRRVPVVASVPYLLTWLNHHPLAKEPDAPFWIKFSDGKAMTYPALAKVIRSAAERARLKKRVHPHALRHSRATFLASKLTEAQMNAVFGWKQGSEMPSIYVHLSGRDIDNAVLGIYGLRKKKAEKPTDLAPKDCPRCGYHNPATGRFCAQCGTALDIETVMELEKKRREADELMSLIIREPEVQEAIKHALIKHIHSSPRCAAVSASPASADEAPQTAQS